MTMPVCMSDQEITNLKISMTELSSDIKYIKDGLEKHIEKEDYHLEKFTNAIENFMASSDRKYASKRVETIFWGGLSVVGSALMLWAVRILIAHGNL